MKGLLEIMQVTDKQARTLFVRELGLIDYCQFTVLEQPKYPIHGFAGKEEITLLLQNTICDHNTIGEKHRLLRLRDGYMGSHICNLSIPLKV